MRGELTLKQRCNQAKDNRDFQEAIAIAHVYKDQKDSRSAVYWLEMAIEFAPNGVELQDHVNLDEFLASFTILINPWFSKSKTAHPLLIDALKKNRTIVEFSSDFTIEGVNKLLADYIAETSTLVALDISAQMHQGPRLNDSHMDFIAHGLRFNTSLEVLDIAENPIRDEGLLILLEALAQNPETKLKELNLFNTGITERGAKALIEFLQNNKSLEWVNLNYNREIPDKYVKEISELTEKNRMGRENAKKIEGETTGFGLDSSANSKPSAISYAIRHSFLANLGERLNVAEALKSRNNDDWLRLFNEAVNPYAKVKFLIIEISKYNPEGINFMVALEHASSLNIDAPLREGVLFNADGSGIMTDTRDVHFSVKGPSSEEYYLSQQASVFQIKLNNIRVKDQQQLEKRLVENFASIRSVIEAIFSKGIYRSGQADFSNLYLADRDRLFNTMKGLVKWWHNARYIDDTGCSPNSSKSCTN